MKVPAQCPIYKDLVNNRYNFERKQFDDSSNEIKLEFI